MKRTHLWLLVPVFVFVSNSVADQLLDACTSAELRRSAEIESIVDQAIKRTREDCIKALLANANFNTRGYVQRSIARLAIADQITVLQTLLKTDQAWVEPKLHGEEVVSFDVVTEGYVRILKGVGVHATEEQLLSKAGRIELWKVLDSLPYGESSSDPGGAVAPSLSMQRSMVPSEKAKTSTYTDARNHDPNCTASAVPMEKSTSWSAWSTSGLMAIAAIMILGMTVWFLRKWHSRSMSRVSRKR